MADNYGYCEKFGEGGALYDCWHCEQGDLCWDCLQEHKESYHRISKTKE